MELTRVDLSKLKLDDKNARKHSARNIEEIKRSLEEFGQHRALVVQRSTNKILIGNGMYQAMKSLGWKDADVYFVDDSDREAAKRALADNRTSDLSEWDAGVLSELVGSLDFDIPGFNEDELKDLAKFDAPDISVNNADDDDDGGYYSDAVEATYNLYRLYEYDETRTAGFYQMPVLKACHFVPDELIGFNYVKSVVEGGKKSEFRKGVHFFLDDYQFERIWKEPHKHIARIQNFACALTPDFSTYADMPMAMKIWNVYRSRLIGQVMQDYGINVIPVIRGPLVEGNEFYIDGVEPGGVIAVSTVGLRFEKELKDLAHDGTKVMIDKLQPECILHYGKPIGVDYGNVRVKYIDPTGAFNGR